MASSVIHDKHSVADSFYPRRCAGILAVCCLCRYQKRRKQKQAHLPFYGKDVTDGDSSGTSHDWPSQADLKHGAPNATPGRVAGPTAPEEGVTAVRVHHVHAEWSPQGLTNTAQSPAGCACCHSFCSIICPLYATTAPCLTAFTCRPFIRRNPAKGRAYGQA